MNNKDEVEVKIMLLKAMQKEDKRFDRETKRVFIEVLLGAIICFSIIGAGVVLTLYLRGSL